MLNGYKWRKKYESNQELDPNKYELEIEYLRDKYAWREKYEDEKTLNLESYETEKEYLDAKYAWRDTIFEDIDIDPEDYETEDEYLDACLHPWREKYKEEISFSYLNLYETEDEYLDVKEKIEDEILYEYSLEKFEEEKLDWRFNRRCNLYKSDYDYYKYHCNTKCEYDRFVKSWDRLNILSAELKSMGLDDEDKLIINICFDNSLNEKIEFTSCTMDYILNDSNVIATDEDDFSFFINENSNMVMKASYGPKNIINQEITKFYNNNFVYNYSVDVKNYSYVKNGLLYFLDFDTKFFSVRPLS